MTALLCLGGLAIFAGSDAMAADITLTDVTLPRKDQATFRLNRVELKNTNLTRDEAAKVFSDAATREETNAILKKLVAASISIPEITFTAKDHGFIIRDVRATDIKDGKIARMTIAGIEASSEVGAGTGALKSGAMVIDNADFGGLLASLIVAGLPTGIRAEKITWSSVEISAPDSDVLQSMPGGNLNHFKLASLEMKMTHDGPVLRTAAISLKHLTIEPSKGSKLAQGMTLYGYDKFDLDLALAGHYDDKAATYALDGLTVSGVNVGSIALDAKLGGIDKSAFAGDKAARDKALANGNVSHLGLRVANTGYFEKSLAVSASRQNKTPQAVKADWVAAFSQLVSTKLGNDPAAKKLKDAIAAFIAEPKSLAITADARGAPVLFSELKKMTTPESLLSLVNIDAAAGK
jgi:hypothetical protein